MAGKGGAKACGVGEGSTANDNSQKATLPRTTPIERGVDRPDLASGPIFSTMAEVPGKPLHNPQEQEEHPIIVNQLGLWCLQGKVSLLSNHVTDTPLSEILFFVALRSAVCVNG